MTTSRFMPQHSDFVVNILFATLFRLHSTEKTMRKTPILTLALLSAILIPAIQHVHAALQTMDGVISDSMCGKKHMPSGKSDADCIAECVKGGAGYALVVGEKVYSLSGKPETIAPIAGKHVKVEGSVKGHIITVASVDEVKATAMPDMSSKPM